MTEQEKTIAMIFDKSVEALGIMTKSLCDAIKSTKTDLQTDRLYTAEDMVDFHRWMKEGIYKNKVGIRFNGEFVKYIEGIPVTLSNEQVIKLWEEQK